MPPPCPICIAAVQRDYPNATRVELANWLFLYFQTCDHPARQRPGQPRRIDFPLPETYR